MVSKVKVDAIESTTGSGTIALNNQFSGMTVASLPTLTTTEMPTGCVIQVKMGYATTEVETTANVGVSSGLQAVITPSSASSSILVLVGLSLQIAGVSSTANPRSSYKIIRQISGGSNTDIYPLHASGTSAVAFNRGDSNNTRSLSWTSYTSHEDSPNTTSAVTYEIWGLQHDGRLMMQPNSVRSNITLMEIAG